MLPTVEPVVLERPADGVAAIRINRPEVRGALDRASLQLMIGYLAELADEEDLAALILSSTDPTAAAVRGPMSASSSTTMAASPG